MKERRCDSSICMSVSEIKRKIEYSTGNTCMCIRKYCAKLNAGETEDIITGETHTAVALHRDRWINR